jgi:hypothetical protein
MVRSVGRQALKSGKILGGLAILEDAWHNTAKLEAVPVDAMERREEENLALVKSWMGRLPANFDILIMDEIGKNISGAGFDTKIVNRCVNGEYNPWPGVPTCERVFIRDINPLSHGNAVGCWGASIGRPRASTCSLPPRPPTPASRCTSPPTWSAWRGWHPRWASWTWEK